jgi:hypothetical protein
VDPQLHEAFEDAAYRAEQASGLVLVNDYRGVPARQEEDIIHPVLKVGILWRG